MHCFACQSAIGPGNSWCSKCGAAVRQRVDPDSERRFVTILRADVVDSTGLVAELEPEAAVSRLEPALAAMRGAVRQFGGIVSKELGDGLAAVFGAPIADDNHAPLACHAAIELVRRVGSLGDPGLQVRVGLHSGHVVAYMVASEFSKVYEIGGAAQHLAARLETAAEANQIYVSEACRSWRTDTCALNSWAARRSVVSASPCLSTGSWGRAICRAGGSDVRGAFPDSSTARPNGRCCGALRIGLLPAGRRFC
jgi:class 3 adenylate cyclase